jgi:hypothetical protein
VNPDPWGEVTMKLSAMIPARRPDHIARLDVPRRIERADSIRIGMELRAEYGARVRI